MIRLNGEPYGGGWVRVFRLGPWRLRLHLIRR